MNDAYSSTIAAILARVRRPAGRGIALLSVLVWVAPAITIAGDLDRFPAGDDFGAGLTLHDTTPLSEVVAYPERFEGKPVLVRGRITDVCQMKGCWTVITDDTVSVRVRFHDYGFFLPKSATRRDAIVEGLVKAEMISEKTARHYASESSSKDDDPSQIHGAQRVVGFTATGVRLLGSD